MAFADEIAQSEFKGKGPEQKTFLRDYLDARGLSIDFCRPVFQKGVRMYRLFAGHPPPEVSGTFSQIMLWFPYAIVDQELPLNIKSMARENWLELNAEDFMLEPSRSTAQKWLRNEMDNVQQFPRTSIPSFQSAHIFGNGYRFYGHRFVPEKKFEDEANIGEMGMVDPANPTTRREVDVMQGRIAGNYINYFNVLPSPNGGMINPPPGTYEAGLDWLIVYMYLTKEEIMAEVNKGNFNRREAELLFNEGDGSDPEGDITWEFKDELINTEGQWNQFSAPEWVNRLKSQKNNLSKRYRTAFFLQRGKWGVIAEDKRILYEGPPWLSKWPVANFKSSLNLDNFFGTGLLEIVEDLIISMILNFNLRMDDLAGKFHPPTYIPQKLIDDMGGDTSNFDWEPYKIHGYKHQLFPGGIDRYIHHDTKPELTEKAFLEQGQMKEYLEDIISQHGAESLNANTATVGAGLMSRDMARAMKRAITIDTTGVHDSAMLTLALGSKFVTEDKRIRTGAEGMPWEKIDHNAIRDGYGISIAGARQMAQAEETFRRQLSMAPMFLQDPQLQPGIIEMKKQLLESGGFENVEKILTGTNDRRPIPVAGAEQKLPGGIPSIQNQSASMNRESSIRSAAPAGAI